MAVPEEKKGILVGMAVFIAERGYGVFSACSSRMQIIGQSKPAGRRSRDRSAWGTASGLSDLVVFMAIYNIVMISCRVLYLNTIGRSAPEITTL